MNNSLNFKSAHCLVLTASLVNLFYVSALDLATVKSKYTKQIVRIVEIEILMLCYSKVFKDFYI